MKPGSSKKKMADRMVHERKRKIPISKEACNADIQEQHAVEKPNASSNHIDDINNLLLLCDVSLVESSNNDKASEKSIANAKKQQEDQRKKEKCAELCESQKYQLALKNKGKEPLSCGPRPGADNTPASFSMNMIDLNQTTPICSSQLKNNAASGSIDLDPMQSKTCAVMYSADLIRPMHRIQIPIARDELMIDSRTSRRPSEFLKHTPKMDNWTELELDALWIGVRRYGQHNWGAILVDPYMYILNKRTPQELATKWKEEILKIFQTPKSLPAVNNTGANTTNALGPGIGRFPLGVDNEALRRRWSSMLYNKHNSRG